MVKQVKHLPHQPEDLSSTLDIHTRVRILTDSSYRVSLWKPSCSGNRSVDNAGLCLVWE